MFSIVITEKGGAQRQLDFEGPDVEIGRLDDNDICLPKSNVSKLHARLSFKDDRFVLVDQKSTNGTYVNGRRIAAPMVVRRGDKIYIGDFILTLVTPDAAGMDPLDRPLRASYAPPRPSVVPPSAAGMPPSAAGQQEPGTRSYAPPPDGSTAAAPRTQVSPRPAMSPSAESMPSPASLRPPPTPREALPSAPEPKPTGPRRRDTVEASTMFRGQQHGAAPSAPPPEPEPELEALHVAQAPLVVGPPTLQAPPQKMSIPAGNIPGGERIARHAQKSVPPWSSDEGAGGGLTSPAVLAPSLRLQGALSMLMERLGKEIDITRPIEGAFPSEHQPLLERLIDGLADEGAIGPDLDRRFLRESAVSEAVGLGPLDRLLANRAVREVVIDGPGRIMADLGGGLTPVSSFFSSANAVLVVARRLMHRAGRELDAHAGVQEAQLPGGGLVQLLLPPLSPKGPLITLRCPPRAQTSPESMITDGMLSSDMLAVLRTAVQERKNILVLGPQGAGISTLLSVLSSMSPDHERVVVIEDSPSLSLLQPHSLPLSRRAAPGLELAALLKHASRLRYDRLVIDDLRAQDALPALTTAAATSGVLLGMHAPDPSAALTQLELFAQLAMGVHGAVASAARTSLAGLLASAMQLLVHVGPGKDGGRRIQSLTEVRGAQGDRLEARMLHRYDGGSFRTVDHR